MVAAYWLDFRVCWLFCVVFPVAIHGTLKSYTMDGNCGETVAIPTQDMRLTLTANGADYRSNMDCALTLQVPIANRIQIQFESLDILSTQPFDHQIYCEDWLEVKDGPSRHNDTVSQMARRVCGKGILNGEDRYTSSTIGRYVTMVFKSGNNRFNHKGFSAILTPYRRAVCAAEEFTCRYNGRCIAYSTICDIHILNPCGDGSARPSDCYWNYWTKVSTTTDHGVPEIGSRSKDIGVTALVSIGVGGGILLLIVGIAIAAYRQMRNRACTGSGRRISRTTRRVFRTRRLTSASDFPDCTLATITSPGLPPSYSEVVCEGYSSSTNPYPDEPPPPYTELYLDMSNQASDTPT